MGKALRFLPSLDYVLKGAEMNLIKATSALTIPTVPRSYARQWPRRWMRNNAYPWVGEIVITGTDNYNKIYEVMHLETPTTMIII